MTNTVSPIVSDDELNRIIQIESSGNPNSKAGTSSALGLGQFLNATWLAVVKQHAPETFSGRTQAQVLALRTNPSFSIEMLARFTEDNKRMIGMAAKGGDLYLAHFLGVGAAKAVFRAPQGNKVIATLGASGPDVAKANPTIVKASTTNAQLRAWAQGRMDKSGGHDWIAKYYKGGSQVMASANDPAAATEFSSQSKADADALKPGGDVDLQTAQKQLRKMNYYTGFLDGLWGSKTSGAISGFLNDFAQGAMAAPTSYSQWKSNEKPIADLLNTAEGKNFTRPVTIEREEEDPQTVAAIAPEVVPAKKGMLASISATVVAFLLAVWDTIANWSLTLWNLFTANKDNLPASATDPSTITQIAHKIPAGLWLFVIAVIFGFIGFNAWKSVRKITKDVATGAR